MINANNSCVYQLLQMRGETSRIVSHGSRKARRVMQSLDRIIATCVHDGALDIFSMCEVGGHRGGLTAAEKHATDLVCETREMSNRFAARCATID